MHCKSHVLFWMYIFLQHLVVQLIPGRPTSRLWSWICIRQQHLAMWLVRMANILDADLAQGQLAPSYVAGSIETSTIAMVLICMVDLQIRTCMTHPSINKFKIKNIINESTRLNLDILISWDLRDLIQKSCDLQQDIHINHKSIELCITIKRSPQTFIGYHNISNVIPFFNYKISIHQKAYGSFFYNLETRTILVIQIARC